MPSTWLATFLQLGQLSGMEVDGVPPPMRHSCLVWASSPPIDRIDQPDVFSSQLRTSLVSFWAAAAARFPVSPVVAACACRCDRQRGRHSITVGIQAILRILSYRQFFVENLFSDKLRAPIRHPKQLFQYCVYLLVTTGHRYH